MQFFLGFWELDFLAPRFLITAGGGVYRYKTIYNILLNTYKNTEAYSIYHTILFKHMNGY